MAQLQNGTAVKIGKDVLKGKEINPRQLLDLVGELKKERAFGLGRKLLDKHTDDPAIRGDPKLRVGVAYATSSGCVSQLYRRCER